MTDKILKVGFDLDGVILYNPLRVIRPLLKAFRSNVVGGSTGSSFIPKTFLDKVINAIYIRSSIIIDPAVKDICQLVDEGKIEGYIVSARASFLKNGFSKWIEKINKEGHFKQCYHNETDMDPYR